MEFHAFSNFAPPEPALNDVASERGRYGVVSAILDLYFVFVWRSLISM